MSQFLLLTVVVIATAFLLPVLAHDNDEPARCLERNFPLRSASNLRYFDNNTELEGFLAVPKTNNRRPGIVLVHQFLGIEDITRNEARRFASLGYIALAADIYGKGVRYDRNNSTQIAQALQTYNSYLNDRAAFRRRIFAALEALRNHPQVDRSRVAVAGYCFGGTAALEAARSGTRLASAFISYHGGLAAHPTGPLGNNGNLTYQKILVLHGRDDPLISATELANFTTEFTNAGSDIQFVSFSQTLHAFTDPFVDIVVKNFPTFAGAVAYNAQSTARSRKYTSIFLQEVFKCTS